MVVPTEVPVPTYAPLREQRRGLRERALTLLYRRYSGQGTEPLPAKALITSETQSARHPWHTPFAFIRGMVSTRRSGRRPIPLLSIVPRTARSSAVSEAALAQRITGLGSGPYSGTPFLVVPRATDAAARPPASDEPCEAARHDHGIIDHSRHVSSIGRR